MEIMGVAVKNISFPIEGEEKVRLQLGAADLLWQISCILASCNAICFRDPQFNLNGISFNGGCSKIKIMGGGQVFFSKLSLKTRFIVCIPYFLIRKISHCLLSLL